MKSIRKLGDYKMTGIAETTYMQALYEIAEADNMTGSILEELFALNSLFSDNPDYLRMLASPIISNNEKTELIDQAFSGRVNTYLLNFLKVLSDNGRISLFSKIVNSYEEKYNADNDILKVTAVTAFTLDNVLLEKLKNKISQVSKKNVSINNVVDPSVIGGIMIKIGDTQLNATVKSQLDVLKKQLRGKLA